MKYRNKRIKEQVANLKKMHKLVVKNGVMLLPIAKGGIADPDEKAKEFFCQLEPAAYLFHIIKDFEEKATKLGFDEVPEEEIVQDSVDMVFQVFEAGYAAGYKYQSDIIFNTITVGSDKGSKEDTAKAVQAFIEKEDAEDRERNKEFYSSFGEQQETLHMMFRDGIRSGINRVNKITNKYLHLKPTHAVGIDGNVRKVN